MKNKIIVELPKFSKEQENILNFLKEAKDKPEQKKINLAKELYSLWKEKKLAIDLFPGVPQRDDYWFLTQILAQSQLYTIDKKIAKFLYLPKKVEFIIIDNYDKSLSNIKEIGEGFVAPTFQEVLVLNHLGLIEISQKPITLSQLRIEPNARPLQLFCGHSDLGGIQYIDGLPKNESYPLKTRYLIKTIY